MTPVDFAPFAIAIAVTFFRFGIEYERRRRDRDNAAAERIRQKYQSHLSRTGSPGRTSKQ